MIACNVLGPNAGRSRTTNNPAGPAGQQQQKRTNNANNMGLPYDPYDYNPLPSRIIATGAATNFPSIANLVGDVFNAPVLVPTTQIDAAQIVPHRNAPPTGYPARAALGGAYVARWVWGKEKGTPAGTGRGGFEEEIRRLLAKRWASSGGAPLRTGTNVTIAGSKPGSGTSTPYGHGGLSGLGSNILVEVDEEEAEEERVDPLSTTNNYGLGAGFGEIIDSAGRLRTFTGSTAGTTMSGTTFEAPSTAFTTPDLGGASSPNLASASSGETPAATTTTSLIPVTAMPTSEAELQLGLAKVAEPDVDAFMSYAAIVPEYCRLEGLLVKSIV